MLSEALAHRLEQQARLERPGSIGFAFAAVVLAWGAAIHLDLQLSLEAGDAVVCSPLDRLDTQLGGDLAR